MTSGLRLGSIVVLSFLLFPFSWAGAQGLDKLVEGAKREGKLKVGLTVRWEEGGKPGAKKIVELFEKRYPFVKVDYERVGGSREREKVFSELTAGRVTYDVTVLSETQVPAAILANVIEMTDWRSLGVEPRSIHPNGVGVSYRTQFYGIAYNRKLAPDSVGSKLSWEDCASPKWQKKVAMDTRPRHLEIFWQPHVWGREKTLAHARQLNKNQTIFVRDRTDAMMKLSLGEHSLVCGAFFSTYYELARSGQGALVGFTPGDFLAVGLGDVVFVPKGATHPNAAKLWVAWSVSEEGQRVLDEVEGSGSPLFPFTQAAKMTKGRKVAWYEPQWRGKADEILAEILEAMGLPVVR